MRLRIYCLLAMLWPVVNGYAQSSPVSIRALTIGDSIPADLEITNIYNYPVSKIQFSDLKGKLVILDFWATWCLSCVKELPRLDSLQKKYKENIQIFIVCYESEQRVKALIKKNKKIANLNLPFIISDSTLNSLFPHRLLPHDVWINKSGKVNAITQSHYVNSENIEVSAAGGMLHLPVKRDVLDFDNSKPLLENGNGGEKRNLLYRSLITSYLPGLFSGKITYVEGDSAMKRFSFFNQPILALYAAALGRPFTNRLILEVKNTEKYIQQDANWDIWANSYCYCYELTLPVNTTKRDAMRKMINDLNAFFEMNISFEKRKIDCWILRKAINYDSIMKSHFKEGKPISYILEKLNKQIPSQPIAPIIIDETGYTGNIDISEIIERDMPGIKKAFQLRGFDLTMENREIEVLVLRETN